MDRLLAIFSNMREFVSKSNLNRLSFEFKDFKKNGLYYFGGPVLNCEWIEELNGFQATGFDVIENVYISDLVTLEMYILARAGALSFDLEDEIKKITFTLDHSKRKVFFNSIEKEIIKIIDEIKVFSDIQNLFLIEFFVSLIRSINEKFTMDSKSSLIDKHISKPQIKWMGSLRTLITLLIQLRDGTNTTGKSLIDCDITELKNLVLNNFLDSNGEPFNKSSVETYLDKNKQGETQAKKDVLYFDENGFIPKSKVTNKKTKR